MSLGRSVVAVARGARSFTKSAVIRTKDEVHPGYKAIKAKQEKFCLEDGKPVHLKGGVLDSILYRLTMGLCIGAVAWDLKLFYDLAQR